MASPEAAARGEAALDKKKMELRSTSRRFPGSPVRGTFFIPFAKPVTKAWVGEFNRSLLSQSDVPMHEFRAFVEGVEFTCNEERVPAYAARLKEYLEQVNAAAAGKADEREGDGKRLVEKMKKQL